MTSELHPAKRILQVISNAPGFLLDDLVAACPDITWNQVFLQVDWMTRTGKIRMRQEKPGQYSLWLPTSKEFGANRSFKEKAP